MDALEVCGDAHPCTEGVPLFLIDVVFVES